MDINYLSEPQHDYAKAISACRSANELRVVTARFKYIASDADAVAAQMLDVEFDEFIAGLKIERTGNFAGAEWCDKYGAVAMPALMVRVMVIATKFGAPFGAAFIRAKEHGLIVEQDGVAVWRSPPPVENAEAA